MDEKQLNWTPLILKLLLCKRHSYENENSSHKLAENICETSLIEDFYPQYTKNLKLKNKKIDNSVKNWVKILNRYLTKEYIQMENKPKRNASPQKRKKCPTSYLVRELHSK